MLTVPSAIVPETFNVLLNPAHPDAARIVIVQATDARPGKLFTASSDLMTGEVGLLTPEARTRIVDAVVALIRDETPTAAEPDLRRDE